MCLQERKQIVDDISKPRIQTDFGICCQCLMETCTGDLAKAHTNKYYQEKEERCTMKNENQCILSKLLGSKVFSSTSSI
jgi:hypothetical protein